MNTKNKAASNPELLDQYDVVVVGAGSGGLTAAIGLVTAGKSVLLIEKDLPGGECTHSGCVPSKALLHAAKQHYSGADALQYVRKTISHVYAEETPEVLRSHGVHYLQGTASFKDKCSISVNNKVFSYKKAIIATGSSPRMIEINGLDQQYILTNQNLFDLKDLPEKLLVVGSGPIGMEMAQAFAILGSQVTIASIDARFARLEDPEISPLIEDKFKKLGITILKNAHSTSAQGTSMHIDIKADFDNPDRVTDTHKVEFDKVLIAIGRVPNMLDGLDEAAIKHTKHGITIDDQYRTSNKHVFAIGDVSQRLKFTHTANEAGRVVTQNLLTKGFFKASTAKAVPKVTYTIPEIAAVGLSHEEAVSKYGEKSVTKITVPFSTNDRAKTDSAEEHGLTVVVAKRLSGKVLGANIIGQNAGEVLASYTLAIDHGLSLWKLRSSIFPYPTISQVVKKSGDVFASQALANWKTDLKNLFKKNLPKLFAVAFWAAILVSFFIYKSANDLTTRGILGLAIDFFQDNQTIAPLLFIALYTLRPIIFFPATLLTALAGVLFGPIYGIIYTFIGENGSANLAYGIGRILGNDLNLEDNKLFGKYVAKARKNPFISVLIMRFIYLPFDLVNYGSGVTKINWKGYALATAVGILPGLTTFVLLGASIDAKTLLEAESLTELAGGFNPLTFAVAAALFIGSLVLAKWYKVNYGADAE